MNFFATPQAVLNTPDNNYGVAPRNAWTNASNAIDGNTGTAAVSNADATHSSSCEFNGPNFFNFTDTAVVVGLEFDYSLTDTSTFIKAELQHLPGTTIEAHILDFSVATRHMDRWLFSPSFGGRFPIGNGAQITLWLGANSAGRNITLYEIRWVLAVRGEVSVMDG